MSTVNLEHGEVATIDWTIDANITGKTVIFAIASRPGATRLVRKTSAGGGGVTVTQAGPTGIGTVAIAEADFAAGKIDKAGTYAYSLWFEDADGSNPIHVDGGTLVVAGTVARTA